MSTINLDEDKVKMLIREIITLEKKNTADKGMSEKQKMQELKKLIEKEVNL